MELDLGDTENEKGEIIESESRSLICLYFSSIFA